MNIEDADDLFSRLDFVRLRDNDEITSVVRSATRPKNDVSNNTKSHYFLGVCGTS